MFMLNESLIWKLSRGHINHHVTMARNTCTDIAIFDGFINFVLKKKKKINILIFINLLTFSLIVNIPSLLIWSIKNCFKTDFFSFPEAKLNHTSLPADNFTKHIQHSMQSYNKINLRFTITR